MAVSGGLPGPNHGYRRGNRRDESPSSSGATRTCGVQVAKVHVKTFYFPSPVMCAPEIYHPLRTVADHPTSINLRMTEGLDNRERYSGGDCPADAVRSVYLDLAVGQPPGQVAHHIPITPHITNAGPHCAEPIYFCLVI